MVLELVVRSLMGFWVVFSGRNLGDEGQIAVVVWTSDSRFWRVFILGMFAAIDCQRFLGAIDTIRSSAIGR